MEVLLQQAVPAHDGHLKSGAKSKQRNGGIVGLQCVMPSRECFFVKSFVPGRAAVLVSCLPDTIARVVRAVLSLMEEMSLVEIALSL